MNSNETNLFKGFSDRTYNDKTYNDQTYNDKTYNDKTYKETKHIMIKFANCILLLLFTLNVSVPYHGGGRMK